MARLLVYVIFSFTTSRVGKVGKVKEMLKEQPGEAKHSSESPPHFSSYRDTDTKTEIIIITHFTEVKTEAQNTSISSSLEIKIS